MKLSQIQLFWLVFIFHTGNMLLIAIGPMAVSSKQDAWISAIIATIVGTLITFIASKVSLLYPKQTLIQYSTIILGKWLGNLIIFSYVCTWLVAMGIVLRGLADFIIVVLLPATPLWIVVFVIMLLVMYITFSGGIQTIGRCSEVFVPIVLIMIIISILFALPNVDVVKILPIVADTSIPSLLKGALSPLTFLGESVMVMMLLSFCLHQQKSASTAIWGVIVSGLSLSIATIIVIMTFGPNLAAKLRYPFFEVIRYISLADFIQHLDILSVSIWMLSAFIKLSVYFFISSYGISQWFKIKKWRKMIWVIAPITFVHALVYANVTTYSLKYMEKFLIPYVLPINMIGIPILLWTVGSIRKRRKAVS